MMKKLILMISIALLISCATAEPIRIACIGNSITAYKGTLANLDLNSYPVQLRILMGEEYDIRNYGVSGRTLLKKGDYPIWIEQAFTEALEFQPNIVTIMLGTNDSKPYNWIYKDEFVQDYISLIDTLRSLPSNPEIYICLPPPAFSSNYDICDSVITNDILPMLQQIITEKSTHTIDCHTPFMGKSNLFYDGIHPTLDGLWEITKIFYTTLKGDEAIAIAAIQDTNLALGKTVLPADSSAISNLVDGDIVSAWACKSGKPIVIDLGAVESTDMIQIILNDSVYLGYKIETSVDNTSWTTAVDKSTSPDSTIIAIESIDAVETRYVRFTFYSGDQALEYINPTELRILKSAVVHGPVVTYMPTRRTDKVAYFDLIIVASNKGGYLNYTYDTAADGLFNDGMGYRLLDEYITHQSIRVETEKYYCIKFYLNGYEIATDTIRMDYTGVNAIKSKDSGQLEKFKLHQNFPNPFNATTTIHYSLPYNSQVKIAIYNLFGRQVRELGNSFEPAGYKSVTWDGRDDSGRHVASGVYFYLIESPGFRAVKKMLLIK
jgi:acyl-CoA thioesterase-1